MTTTSTRRAVPSVLRSYARPAEDDDEAQPTRVYVRDDRMSGVMRAPPRDFRGRRPADPIVGGMIRERRPLILSVDPSQPLTFTSSAANVFLLPPRSTDPPPPWAVARVESRKKRRSLLLFDVLAMTVVIGLGLWQSEPARAAVAKGLVHAAHRVSALVVEMTIR